MDIIMDKQKIRDLNILNRFTNLKQMQEFTNKAFGFDIKVVEPKNWNKGRFAIYNALELFEKHYENNGLEFQHIIDWFLFVTPFEVYFDGKWMNFDYGKKYYEILIKDTTIS